MTVGDDRMTAIFTAVTDCAAVIRIAGRPALPLRTRSPVPDVLWVSGWRILSSTRAMKRKHRRDRMSAEVCFRMPLSALIRSLRCRIQPPFLLSHSPVPIPLSSSLFRGFSPSLAKSEQVCDDFEGRKIVGRKMLEMFLPIIFLPLWLRLCRVRGRKIQTEPLKLKSFYPQSFYPTRLPAPRLACPFGNARGRACSCSSGGGRLQGRRRLQTASPWGEAVTLGSSQDQR